jgi:hypothetical protein
MISLIYDFPYLLFTAIYYLSLFIIYRYLLFPLSALFIMAPSHGYDHFVGEKYIVAHGTSQISDMYWNAKDASIRCNNLEPEFPQRHLLTGYFYEEAVCYMLLAEGNVDSERISGCCLNLPHGFGLFRLLDGGVHFCYGIK